MLWAVDLMEQGHNPARHIKGDDAPRHASDLYQRTADHIGSLTRLTRQAAITANLRRHRTHHQENAGRRPARPLRRGSQTPPHPQAGHTGMMRT